MDGTHELHLADCGIETCGEDGRSCCEFSQEDEEDFTRGLVAAVGELQSKVHSLDPEYFRITSSMLGTETLATISL